MAVSSYNLEPGLSPEELRLRRRMAIAQLMQGSQPQKIQHWMQGAGNLADAVVGGMNLQGLRQQEEDARRRGIEAKIKVLEDISGASSAPAASPAATTAPAPATPASSANPQAATGPMPALPAATNNAAMPVATTSGPSSPIPSAAPTGITPQRLALIRQLYGSSATEGQADTLFSKLLEQHFHAR
jgi:hypothetical protein